MISLDNKIKNNFIDAFDVAPGRKQNAIYFGAAEAVVDYLIHAENNSIINTNIPKFKLDVERIMDKIGELVILDRDKFKRCVEVTFKYKTVAFSSEVMRTRLRKIVIYNSLYEFLGVTEYYSQEDILDINSNFDAYRNAATATLKWFESEKEAD